MTLDFDKEQIDTLLTWAIEAAERRPTGYIGGGDAYFIGYLLGGLGSACADEINARLTALRRAEVQREYNVRRETAPSGLLERVLS